VSEMPLTSEKVRLTCTAAYPPCQLTADGLQDSAKARTQTRNRRCDNANADVQGPAVRTGQRGRAKLHGRKKRPAVTTNATASVGPWREERRRRSERKMQNAMQSMCFALERPVRSPVVPRQNLRNNRHTCSSNIKHTRSLRG
jgi:hypothetical protein